MIIFNYKLFKILQTKNRYFLIFNYYYRYTVRIHPWILCHVIFSYNYQSNLPYYER
jgi:hypothetical protein